MTVPTASPVKNVAHAPKLREATFGDYAQIAALEASYGLTPRRAGARRIAVSFPVGFITTTPKPPRDGFAKKLQDRAAWAPSLFDGNASL